MLIIKGTYRLLDEISEFIAKDTSNFWTLLITKDQRIAKIDEYHRRVGTLVTSFQASLSYHVAA